MYLGGLCFITDRKVRGISYNAMVCDVLKAGVSWIQYREKNSSRRELYEQALKIKNLTENYSFTFIVNDWPDIALAVDADGVHIGQEDLPLKEARKIMGDDKVIGVSTHSLQQAIEAEEGGADYIGFGSIFHTETKDAGLPKGIKTLEEIKRNIKLPIVAIGGIKLENLESVLDAGVDAVAVASGILLSSNIEDQAGRFMEIINTYNKL